MILENNLQRLPQIFYSVRYLQPIQWWGRLRLFAQRKGLHRLPAYNAHYVNSASGHEPFVTFPLPIAADRAEQQLSYNCLEALSNHQFTFLNRTVPLGDPINWYPASETQLWQYNLHYFDYALGLAWSYVHHHDPQAYLLFCYLVNDWITKCPIPTRIAWDSYPISLRINNWLKAYSVFEPMLETDKEFAASLRRSIYMQAHFLEDHVEYHLMGNHVIENGRALLMAGLFFQDDNGIRWRQKGIQILWKELEEEFLPDGGHYERSPMYHQIMLELYQEVIVVLDAHGFAVPEIARERVAAMQKWLHIVLHPDGDIPLLNDAALGIAGRPYELLSAINDNAMEFQDEPQLGDYANLHALPDSGYFIFKERVFKDISYNDAALVARNGDLATHRPNTHSRQLGPSENGTSQMYATDEPCATNKQAQDYLIFDCGPLGPDYFPSHGHCDTLSYELSLEGQRFIVDSGVESYYGDLDWRLYYRSTRAHNTLVIDGAEQSEIWDRFRVGRRAHPAKVTWIDNGKDLAYVIGAHTGYQRLEGKVTHYRAVCWIERRFWLICDYVIGSGEYDAESLLHFHPDVTINTQPTAGIEGRAGVVQRGSSTLQVVPWGIDRVTTYYGELDPKQGWYAPEFGQRYKNAVWGLHRKITAPTWLGYLLWPGSDEVQIQHINSENEAVEIEIAANDRHYVLNCNVDRALLKSY